MKEENKRIPETPVTRRQVLGSATAAAAFTIVPRHVWGGAGQAAQRQDEHRLRRRGRHAGRRRRWVAPAARTSMRCATWTRSTCKTAASDSPRPSSTGTSARCSTRSRRTCNGITITIPDHMHATVALWAMERGIAVHCQKPLTQTVWEARLLTKAAQKYKVATQMGNQGYSSEATRMACEIIWNGDIGDVTEVHSWSGGGFVPRHHGVAAGRAGSGDAELEPVDRPGAEHTYSSKIHPINWRGFLEYGTQMIGDWGIHMLGPANWALQLGETPTSVECTAVEGVNPVTYPAYSCKMEFPERPNKFVPSGKMPPVDVYWYEGSMARNVKPPEGLTAEDMRGINEIFVGTKGFLGTSGRGESVSLLPRIEDAGLQEARRKCCKRSPGHFQDWIRACKGGEPACSNFSIAGPYAEWMLLGRHLLAIPQREAAVGRQEPALHQQREGQRIREAQVPQGLGTQGHHSLTLYRPEISSMLACQRKWRKPSILLLASTTITRLGTLNGWFGGWRSCDESKAHGHALDDAGGLDKPASAGCDRENPCVAGSG